MAGIALLACMMGAAAAIHSFVLGRPGDAVIPGLFLIGLVVFGWSGRSQGGE